MVALVGEVAPFLFVITIVWLALHYRQQRRMARTVEAADSASHAELAVLAERMERRIEALEQILDAEAPGWRKRHHEH